jgi:hypothetical protein
MKPNAVCAYAASIRMEVTAQAPTVGLGGTTRPHKVERSKSRRH